MFKKGQLEKFIDRAETLTRLSHLYASTIPDMLINIKSQLQSRKEKVEAIFDTMIITLTAEKNRLMTEITEYEVNLETNLLHIIDNAKLMGQETKTLTEDIEKHFKHIIRKMDMPMFEDILASYDATVNEHEKKLEKLSNDEMMLVDIDFNRGYLDHFTNYIKLCFKFEPTPSNLLRIFEEQRDGLKALNAENPKPAQHTPINRVSQTQSTTLASNVEKQNQPCIKSEMLISPTNKTKYFFANNNSPELFHYDPSSYQNSLASCNFNELQEQKRGVTNILQQSPQNNQNPNKVSSVHMLKELVKKSDQRNQHVGDKENIQHFIPNRK